MDKFSVRVEVAGNDQATPQALEHAVRYLMAQALRSPPDRRFKWDVVTVKREDEK